MSGSSTDRSNLDFSDGSQHSDSPNPCSPSSSDPSSGPFLSANSSNAASNSPESGSPKSPHPKIPTRISGFTRSRPSDEDEDTVPSMKFNKLGLASRYINQLESSKPPDKPKRTKSKKEEHETLEPDDEEKPKPRRKPRRSSYALFHQLPAVPPSPSRTPIEPPYNELPQSPELLASPEFHRHEYRHPRTTPDVLMEEVISVDSSHHTDSIPEVEEVKETVMEKFFRIILQNEHKLFNITYRLRQKARRYVRHHPETERDLTSCCGNFCDQIDQWRWNFWRLFYFIYDFFDRWDAKRRDKWRDSRAAVENSFMINTVLVPVLVFRFMTIRENLNTKLKRSAA